MGAVAAVLAAGTAAPLRDQRIQISKENMTVGISTSDDAFTVADTAVVSVGY